jgi:hypothetical protein
MALALAVAVAACAGGNDNPPDATVTPDAGLKGVYVAGEGSFWVDGVHHMVKANDEGELHHRQPQMNSIFVSGDDIYMGGYEPTTSINRFAVLWKNGKYQYLSDGATDASVNSVLVAGEDVYAVGYKYMENGRPRAALWVNGDVQYLPCAIDPDNNDGTNARGIFVSGKDVYVAGSEDENYAILWKNGTPQRLETEGGRYAHADSVFASGSDIYVAGGDWIDIPYGPRAVLWKNGEPQYLQTAAAANSVFVYGNDVYVCGNAGLQGNLDRLAGVIWKNGKVQHYLGNGSRPMYVNSLYVLKGDTYVVGYQETDTSTGTPMLWKNGEIQPLWPENPRADVIPHSVFAIERD